MVLWKGRCIVGYGSGVFAMSMDMPSDESLFYIR